VRRRGGTLFGGSIAPLENIYLLAFAMLVSPVYWGFRAVHLNTRTLPEKLPGYADHLDDIWMPCGALLLQSVILLVLAVAYLKRKDA
jgi:hypothetical protein